MRDILSDVEQWLRDGKSVALATVVQTWGSSPRKAGSKMALTLDGRITGSVSGGCVENAVIEAGVESLRTMRPQLLHFGVADETAWEVGLACGGSIDVFVKPLDKKFFEEHRSVIESEGQAAAITIVRGANEKLGREMMILEDGRTVGSLGDNLDGAVLRLAAELLGLGISRLVHLDEETEAFVDVILPSPTLIAVGAVHITVSLVAIAKTLGYRTVVIDPRRAWGNKERFPNVDQLIPAWPQDAFKQVKMTRSTAIAMLTHDPKLDDPALKIALSGPAFYVGALGSKTTQTKRRERLLREGLTELQLSHLHAPIGLDIGAQSPEEIALAIMAQVVAAHRKQDQPSPMIAAELHPTV